jgi:hypothetical protein
VAFLTAGGTNKNDEILSNSGTVTWTGTAVAAGNDPIQDEIVAPVLNNGTFNVNGGTNGNTTVVAGLLSIQGSDLNTLNDSFDMESGSLNLTNGATLIAVNDYIQDGGQLTSDNSTCSLQAGTQKDGKINVYGGSVVVDNVLNSTGTLKFLAARVGIDAWIEVNGLTTGGQSNTCDLLDCASAAVTLGSNSLLDVGTTGTGALGTGNQWTLMQYGSITGSWGQLMYPTGMNTPSTGANFVLETN